MSISGELRHLGERPHIDRRDTRIASADDKIAIDRIETMLRENRAIAIGSGRSADVTLLDIWRNSEQKPWVIKQEVRRTHEQELLNTTLAGELLLHELVYSVIERARTENPSKTFAVIPKPLSHLQDESRQWLLMDYLPGENLYVRIYRAHLLAFETDEDERENIKKMGRDELAELLFSETYINTLPARIVQEYRDGKIDAVNDKDHWRMIALGVNRVTNGPSVILTKAQHEALTNTIEALHKANIHHRDLHPGNIQLLLDGSVGLLDFGMSAVTDKEGKLEKGLYTVDVGHEFHERAVAFTADDVYLKNYWDVARKVA